MAQRPHRVIARADVERLWASLVSAVGRVDSPYAARWFDEHTRPAMVDALEALGRVQSAECALWIRRTLYRWTLELDKVDATTEPDYVWPVVLQLPAHLRSLVDVAVAIEGGEPS